MVADPETYIPVREMGKQWEKSNAFVMKCYYKNKEATETPINNGWFHSGDLAVVYPDGYIQIKTALKI